MRTHVLRAVLLALIALPMHSLAQLNGTYTIGGSNPDYPTITAAVVDAVALGVTGPTTFNIRDGVYNEQLQIPSIFGASAANPVVFQSESGNADDVTIQFQNTNNSTNYVVQLNGTSFVSFANVTVYALAIAYDKCVTLAATGNITACEMNGVVFRNKSNAAGENVLLEPNVGQMTFDGCEFVYGRDGIEATAQVAGGKLRVENSQFYGQFTRCLHVSGTDTVEVINNQMGLNDTIPHYANGMQISFAVELLIERNQIDAVEQSNFAGNIMLLGAEPNAVTNARIVNNMGVLTSVSSGDGISIAGFDNVEIYYNTMYVDAPSGYSGEAALNISYNCQQIWVANNILVHQAQDANAILYPDTSVVLMDYNALYSPINLAYVGGTQYQNFLQYQTTFAPNAANSIYWNPDFPLAPDLHAPGGGVVDAATPLASVTVDLDGDLRDAATPDMGADEFVPIPPLEMDSVVGSAGACPGVSSGTAIAYAVGGTMPYTYAWSNGATAQINTQLAAGTYTVTVTEANGATVTGSHTIAAHNAVTISVGATQSACGGGTGSAWASGVNGQPPFSYSWSNGAVTDTITSAAVGTYTVTVTDANTCTQAAQIEVEGMDGPDVSIVVQDASCLGCCDGTAEVEGSGTVAPYGFSWSTGSSAALQTGLCSDWYYVTVFDANLCSTVDSAYVGELMSLQELARAQGDFEMWPIPAHTTAFIDASVFGNTAPVLTIYSVDGVAVLRKQLPASAVQTVDVSGLAAGMYVAALHTDRLFLRQTFVVAGR